MNEDEHSRPVHKQQNGAVKSDADISRTERGLDLNQILSIIPIESLKYYGVLPLSLENNALVVGAVNPDSLDTRDALNFFTSPLGITYTIKKITQEEFDRKIEEQQNLTAPGTVEQVLKDVDLDSFADVSLSEFGQEFDDKDSPMDTDAPVIRIVASIIKKGVLGDASDVHIDPSTFNSIVRFRVDGRLNKVYDIPKRLHNALVTRLKILSNLRLDERRKPQDGRFSSHIEGKRIDFRISTLPTTNGEKVILRLLSQASSAKSITDLGMAELDEKKARQAIEFSNGLILATGPTGSGKTVSIYSFLDLIDKIRKNVVSLEDPVEITVDSVAQSQMFPEIGYTFASGLRSVLRGDPDVIFVGEIRDRETAQLAIQSALTGHLVFSTLHTNSAIGAIVRLIDLGVEPFFIAPTLRMVIGQRLTRKIHKSGAPIPLSPLIKKKFEDQFASLPENVRSTFPRFDTVYTPVPSDETPDGLKGRVGVFETLFITDRISEAILNRVSDRELFDMARSDGYTTIEEDAFLKAVKGIIPITETARVSGDHVLFKHFQEDRGS